MSSSTKKNHKGPNRNSEVEKYSEWNEKYSSINIRMCQSEERICEVEDGSFEIIQSEENKEWKRIMKAYVIYGIQSKETTCKLLEFQREKGADSLLQK